VAKRGRRRFQKQFDAAIERLTVELDDEVRGLPEVIKPLCENDFVLDAALVGLRAGTLDAGQRLGLSEHVRGTQRANRLDRLILATGRARSSAAARSGRPIPSLPRRSRRARAPRTWRRTGDGSPSSRTAVARAAGDPGALGARGFDAVLSRVGKSQGLDLSLAPPPIRLWS